MNIKEKERIDPNRFPVDNTLSRYYKLLNIREDAEEKLKQYDFIEEDGKYSHASGYQVEIEHGDAILTNPGYGVCKHFGRWLGIVLEAEEASYQDPE